MTWDELAALDVEPVLAWASEQPWTRAMADCQQDAGWHAEGDVWTHTCMVCRQLPRLDEWRALCQHDRTALIFTALFHDAGKPLTSHFDAEAGRIRSPKHALAGEKIARRALRELECPLPIREEIARLARYHGRPAFLLEREQPEREVISLSWLVSNRLLFLFALADTRGRKTAEMSRSEDNLHLWKLASEEHGCFERPFSFANDRARFLFYRRPDHDLHYVPHEDYRCTVTMMSGLPGSGKDTWLRDEMPELPVVSLDDIRAELDVAPSDDQGQVVQAAREQCRELLRAKTSFTFNATSLLRQTRQRWIDLFADYGARIEIVYLEPPLATVLQRNKRRDRPVPEEVILELADKCEPPNWTECHGLALIGG